MDNWHKSSYSGPNSGCVEVNETTGGSVLVRDTQNRDAGRLSFPAMEWSAFLADLRNGVLYLRLRQPMTLGTCVPGFILCAEYAIVVGWVCCRG
jgi:hypothetical protein